MSLLLLYMLLVLFVASLFSFDQSRRIPSSLQIWHLRRQCWYASWQGSHRAHWPLVRAYQDFLLLQPVRRAVLHRRAGRCMMFSFNPEASNIIINNCDSQARRSTAKARSHPKQPITTKMPKTRLKSKTILSLSSPKVKKPKPLKSRRRMQLKLSTWRNWKSQWMMLSRGSKSTVDPSLAVWIVCPQVGA